MDQRGKQLLGYVDSELSNKGGYDLVHYDDLSYVASAHQECKSCHYRTAIHLAFIMHATHECKLVCSP